MEYISTDEVKALSCNDRVKALDDKFIKMYIDGASSMLNNYTFNTTKDGFVNAAKLAASLLIDFLAFSNTGGGAFETERVGDATYNMRDQGLQKKISEVELILGPFIIAGGKRVRTCKIVRSDSR